MALSNVETRKFTVEEYALMGEAGIFRPGERVELIEGEIVPMSPHNLAHANRIAKLNTLFVLSFGKTHQVRVQLPLTLSQHSEPEPDFAMVSFEAAEQGIRHPSHADLVVEIADSSLRYDRAEKASLYAKAGLPEYWLINLKHQRVEVRRQPGPDQEGNFGWGYGSTTLMGAGQDVSPLFRPDVVFSVAQLLE